jgi:acyl-CoA thioesterase-1
MTGFDIQPLFLLFWHRVHRLLFFPLLLLVSCSRTPEAAAPAVTPPPPAAAAAPVDDRPVIVAFGDSLSAGFGVDPGLSYPDFLQKEIDRRGYRYRVANLGISGDTTSGGLSRAATAVELKPAIVILELGGNDGLRGVPVEETRANIEKLIQTFQQAGAKVVVAGMTLPPNYGPEYVKKFERIFIDLARAYKCPRIPFLLEGVWDSPGLMQQDGIHPTAQGNEKVAALVMRTLEPHLAR